MLRTYKLWYEKNINVKYSMDMIGNCEQVKIEQNIYSTSNEPYFLIMSYFLEHCALSALHSHIGISTALQIYIPM